MPISFNCKKLMKNYTVIESIVSDAHHAVGYGNGG